MDSIGPEHFESPSSAAFGDCVVCGIPCWSRCSTCASNGCDWMYFCSVEHQTLVWFTHKRVCGVNSIPFRWPLFSSDEALDALALLRGPDEVQTGNSPREKYLANPDGSVGMTMAEIEHRLHIVRQTTTVDSMFASKRSTISGELRRYIFKLRSARQTKATGRLVDQASLITIIALDPFGASQMIHRSYKSLYSDVEGEPSWVDPLLHKIEAFFSVLSVYYHDTSTFDLYRPLLQYTRDEIFRYCQVVVWDVDPELSDSLQGSLAHSFSNETFLPIEGYKDNKSAWKQVFPPDSGRACRPA